MNKPYIVFDLDDTLFYEQDFLTSAYREIADFVSENNAESVHQKMLELYHQKQDAFAYVAAQYNVSKDDLITMYRSHFPSVSLRAGVLGILENLAGKDIKMGLLTDGRTLTQNHKIDALNIRHFFDKIIISEEFGSEKPNLANYKIFEKPGYDYYYVADNPKKDFVAPNTLGWKTLMITDEEAKKIHQIPDFLDDSYLPQYTLRWENFSEFI